MKNTNWKTILKTDLNDPNLSLNNLHDYINKILDMYAPYEKLSKKEIKLKSKPWISNEILSLMKKRDKLLFKYAKHKKKKCELAINLYNVCLLTSKLPHQSWYKIEVKPILYVNRKVEKNNSKET